MLHEEVGHLVEHCSQFNITRASGRWVGSKQGAVRCHKQLVMSRSPLIERSWVLKNYLFCQLLSPLGPLAFLDPSKINKSHCKHVWKIILGYYFLKENRGLAVAYYALIKEEKLETDRKTS